MISISGSRLWFPRLSVEVCPYSVSIISFCGTGFETCSRTTLKKYSCSTQCSGPKN